MAAYLLICLGLGLLTLAGAGDPATMVPYPAVAGYYLAVQRKDRAAGIVLLGCVTGFLASDSAGLGLAYGLAAASGICFARGWTVGRAAAAVTAMLSMITIAIIAAHPQETLDNVLNQFNAFAVAVGDSDLDREAVAKEVQALGELLPYVGFGLICGVTALFVSFAAALVAKRLRIAGRGERLPGRFRDARTPDWLVWVAIAAALLWLVEDQWPHAGLRMVTWNTAVGLVPIYWLNGFGIVLYGLKAFKITGFWYYLPLVVIFLPQTGGTLVLTSLGFFDTWWELRRRMDLVAARRKDQNDDND